MSYQRLLATLFARRRLILIILGSVVVFIVAVTLLLPKSYTAVASVVIDAKIDPVAGGAVSDQLLSSYVATQQDVIASERVAQRVVKALKLDDDPELRKKWKDKTDGVGDMTEWLAPILIDKNLKVSPAHESLTHPGNVINIGVKWPDPHVAALMANAFAQAAIETNIELKIEPAKEYAKWFDERSRVLRANLEAKQKALSDLQLATGITATDGKLDVETARLTELSTELVAIQGQRQDSQSREHQVGVDNDSLPEVLQSPLITGLKNDLSSAEARRTDAAARLGKNHPDYQEAEAEVENLHLRIQQETAKIAASLGSTARVDLRRESDIKAALDAQKKRVLDLKHQHDQVDVLSNDVTTAQRDMDAVTQRFADSSLESQIQQTNVVLLTTAVDPIDPSSPKLLINLLVALFLGSVAGIGAALILELRNPLVRTEEEVTDVLAVPILGRIESFAALKGAAVPAQAPSAPRLEPSPI